MKNFGLAEGMSCVFTLYAEDALSISDFTLSIYDRWRGLLFQLQSDTPPKWDGMNGGEQVPMRLYIYIPQCTFDGEPILRKGEVMVVR